MLLASQLSDAQQLKPWRLEQLRKRYPAADANKDGKLTREEALAFQKKANGRKAQKKAIAPPPKHANIEYGPFDRNVLDLWLPESDSETPLVVYIHGGGFVGGKKESIRSSKAVQQALDEGVAFASIQYRFRYPDSAGTSDPQRTGIQNILRDSARAVQYLRHHAAKYNLDGDRVACYGGSAGAGTSLWLATHDDLADPDNEDPVLRQSSRISVAGMLNGQFSYDLMSWDPAFADRDGDIVKTHGQNGRIEPHAFYGINAKEFAGEAGKKVRADVDMRNLITPDDPPIFILTTTKDVSASTRGIYNHHPRHGELIEQRCKSEGVDVLCLLPKVREEDAERMAAEPDVMMHYFFQHLGVTDE